MNGFAQRLARVRKESKMTQNEVAERLNVSFHGPVIIGLN